MYSILGWFWGGGVWYPPSCEWGAGDCGDVDFAGEEEVYALVPLCVVWVGVVDEVADS